MFKNSKFTLALIVFFIVFTVLFLQAHKEAQLLHRDPQVLMNRYYLLRQSNPQAAENALKIVLQQDKSHLQALQEMSQIYIQEHRFQAALPLMIQLHHLVPQNEDYTLQLALLYYKNGEWGKAQPLLNELKKGQSWDSKLNAQELLNQMASYVPFYQNNALIASIKPEELKGPSEVVNILLNYFYTLQKNEPQKAEQLLILLNTLNAENTTIPLEQRVACF